MSKYQDFTPNQFLEEIRRNSSWSDDFCLENDQDRALLKNTIELDPRIFVLLPENLVTEDVALVAVKSNPGFFDELPKNVRTKYLKLEALKNNPTVIELFDLDDIDYDCIEYLFIHYEEILYDFDDRRIQHKINRIIKKIKKTARKKQKGLK